MEELRGQKRPNRGVIADDSTPQGRDLLRDRQENKDRKKAYSVVTDSYSDPVDVLEEWGKIKMLVKTDPEQKAYVEKMNDLVRQARQVNDSLRASNVQFVGECLEARIMFAKLCEDMFKLNKASPFHTQKLFLDFQVNLPGVMLTFRSSVGVLSLSRSKMELF